ncbi:hypothetical protein [Helicobacter sp. 12S02232-10]|uniref:hypothetical protein n=1 Tax=Helicobacter sp. 12S02232-10 TaxID=1476197 RepID=UPI0015DF8B9E|nr:hypothetical protein [Helicobacter sp. 12S02232-10]
MQMIDWVGIILITGVILFGIYKLLNLKSSSKKGCGCGGNGKCSKPKAYHFDNKKS